MNLVLAAAVAAFSGFVGLSSEILWYRAFSVASGSSPMTFGLLLGFYLAGIAAGSYGARAFCRDRETGEPRHLAAIGGFLLAANALSFCTVPALAWAAAGSTWENALPVVAVASAAMGAVLPLVAHFGVPADHLAGDRVARIYVANVAGSTLGCLLTGFVLMDLFTLRQISVFLTVTGSLFSAALMLRARLRPFLRSASVLLAFACAALSLSASPPLFDALWEKLTWKTGWDGASRFDVVVENRNDIIAVTRDRIVYGGGAYEGAITLDPLGQNLLWRAYAVAAVHPAPRRILVVGLATGAWTQILAHAPGVESVVAIEINPGYLDVIPRYPEVAPLLHNPRVTVVVDDGRRWLTRHPDQSFDLIVQNTPLHWRAHITHIVSREYLSLVRSRLRPGGIFYFNSTFSPSITATALQSFPHVSRLHSWLFCSPDPVTPDLIRFQSALLHWSIDGIPVFPAGEERDGRLRATLSAVGRFEERAELERFADGAPAVTDDGMQCEWADRFAH